MGGRERLERAPDRLPQLLRERRVENVKIPPLALNDILRVVRVHHRARSVQTALRVRHAIPPRRLLLAEQEPLARRQEEHGDRPARGLERRDVPDTHETTPQMSSSQRQDRTTRHGLPAATTPLGTSRTTTLPAPTMLSAPIETPGHTITPPPSHAREPIVIGRASSAPAVRVAASRG